MEMLATGSFFLCIGAPMKKVFTIRLFVSLFVSVLLSQAHAHPDAYDALSLAKPFAEATASSNADQVAEFLSKDHIHVNPFGMQISGDEFLEDIRSGKLYFDFYNIESFEVLPLSDDVYLGFGVVHACAHREGKEMSGHFRFVHVIRESVEDNELRWESIFSQHTKMVMPSVFQDSCGEEGGIAVD